MPDVFLASAVADSGIAVLRAVEDFARGSIVTNAVEKIGLARPDAVRLTMSSTVSEDIRRRVVELSEQVKSGAVAVPTTWIGPEFPNPT